MSNRKKKERLATNKKNVPDHLRKTARKCIFCGEPGLSATHIWPDWLNRDLPGPTRTLYRDSIFSPNPEKIIVERNSEMKQGNIFSQKPKLACVSCNTGWMNGIEQNILSFIRPYISDKKTIKLDRKSTNDFANWIILITILAEYIGKKHTSVIAEERYRFYRKRTPFENWIIYVGTHESDNFSRFYQHWEWREGITPNTFTHIVRHTEGPINQTSTFGIGPLIIKVFSRSESLSSREFITDCQAHGMKQLWPPQRRLLWPLAYRYLTLGANAPICESALLEIPDGFNLRLQYRSELRRPIRYG